MTFECWSFKTRFSQGLDVITLYLVFKYRSKLDVVITTRFCLRPQAKANYIQKLTDVNTFFEVCLS